VRLSKAQQSFGLGGGSPSLTIPIGNTATNGASTTLPADSIYHYTIPMSPWASRLREVATTDCIWTAKAVDFEGYRFQVPRIRAASDATKVIERQPGRNRAAEVLVRPTMGEDASARRCLEPTVPSSIQSAQPHPATRLGDLFDEPIEPLCGRKSLSWHSANIALMQVGA
jgi:hypothetical protein